MYLVTQYSVFGRQRAVLFLRVEPLGLVLSPHMYHLLKGFHEYLTRYDLVMFKGVHFSLFRKEEFSVIIIGLDGAGKTVRVPPRRLTR